MDNNLIKVVRVIDQTPAAKVGVKVNDLITHLDGQSVDGLTINQAIAKMRGPVNTKIKVRIVREGQNNPIELSVTREIIQPRSPQTQVQQ